MTELKPISRKEYEALLDRKDLPTFPWLEEIEWYSSPEHGLVGVVIHDHVDNDYSWVLIARLSRSEWVLIKQGINEKTPDGARVQLRALSGLAKNQKFGGNGHIVCEQDQIDSSLNARLGQQC
jgi:hypothetical protein